MEEHSPGCSEVIAHYTQTQVPPAHVQPPTPGVQNLDARYLSHSRLQARYSSHFFVTHPPPLNLPLRPHCHLGIYRCQRSHATRAATIPHRLRQWKYRTRLIDGIYHLNGSGFLTSLYSSGFYSFILVIISMYLFGFEKLVSYYMCGGRSRISSQVGGRRNFNVKRSVPVELDLVEPLPLIYRSSQPTAASHPLHLCINPPYGA